MKATGITRKIDELGRIVLPIELRKQMDIAERDPMEIYVEDDMIILKKYEPACTFCGSMKGIKQFRDKNVCAECAQEISK